VKLRFAVDGKASLSQGIGDCLSSLIWAVGSEVVMALSCWVVPYAIGIYGKELELNTEHKDILHLDGR